jgi:hypothetical protein
MSRFRIEQVKASREIQVFERATNEMVQSFSGVTIVFRNESTALLRLKPRTYVWIDTIIIKFTTTEEILSIDAKHHAHSKRFTYVLNTYPPYRLDEQGHKHPFKSLELSHCCRPPSSFETTPYHASLGMRHASLHGK